MSSPLDDLFTPEELAEREAWSADAYRIVVEVPTSKLTAVQLDELYDAIGSTVYDWEDSVPGRDWDALLYGHGPMHRLAES